MKLKIACISALLAQLVQPAGAAQPFEGRWAADRTWCSRSVDDAPLDERPVTFTLRDIDFYVLSCQIRKIEKLGSRFRLRSICDEEGEEGRSPRNWLLSVEGNRLSLYRDGEATVFERCP